MRIFLLITKTTGFPSSLYWVQWKHQLKERFGHLVLWVSSWLFVFLENEAQTHACACMCPKLFFKHLTQAYMASTKRLHFSLLTFHVSQDFRLLPFSKKIWNSCDLQKSTGLKRRCLFTTGELPVVLKDKKKRSGSCNHNKTFQQ